MIHRRSWTRSRDRRGMTLMEVVVVMTILGIMVSIPVPTFLRSIEQSKLDVAAGHLRAIWAAERMFHLEHGRYGTLAELAPGTGGDGDLIDPAIASGDTFYGYTIVPSDDGQSFVATATHPDQPSCTGSVTIDERGMLTCGVTYNGQAMFPSMEPSP